MTTEKKTEDGDVLGTGEVHPAPEQASLDAATSEADKVAVAKDLAEKPTHRQTMGTQGSPFRDGEDVPGLPNDFGVAGLRASFSDRFREKTGKSRRDEAFRAFFEVAGEMNEFAHAIGIRGAVLDADTGDVTVTFSSREPAQSA